MPQPVAVIVAGGHKVSGQQKTDGFFFSHSSQLTRMTLMLCCNKLNIEMPLQSEIYDHGK